MLIALAFAHFSSKLLLKEQMIIPVKKTLNNAGHIDAELIDFSEICQKKSSKIGCFLLIVSWQTPPPPRNFLWNRPIFLIICPWKSFEIWIFSTKIHEIGRFFANFDFSPAKILPNWLIFLRILTFFPPKSYKIGQIFREILLFFPEISEALPVSMHVHSDLLIYQLPNS